MGTVGTDEPPSWDWEARDEVLTSCESKLEVALRRFYGRLAERLGPDFAFGAREDAGERRKAVLQRLGVDLSVPLPCVLDKVLEDGRGAVVLCEGNQFAREAFKHILVVAWALVEADMSLEVVATYLDSWKVYAIELSKSARSRTVWLFNAVLQHIVHLFAHPDVEYRGESIGAWEQLCSEWARRDSFYVPTDEPEKRDKFAQLVNKPFVQGRYALLRRDNGLSSRATLAWINIFLRTPLPDELRGKICEWSETLELLADSLWLMDLDGETLGVLDAFAASRATEGCLKMRNPLRAARTKVNLSTITESEGADGTGVGAALPAPTAEFAFAFIDDTQEPKAEAEEDEAGGAKPETATKDVERPAQDGVVVGSKRGSESDLNEQRRRGGKSAAFELPSRSQVNELCVDPTASEEADGQLEAGARTAPDPAAVPSTTANQADEDCGEAILESFKRRKRDAPEEAEDILGKMKEGLSRVRWNEVTKDVLEEWHAFRTDLDQRLWTRWSELLK
ncbi:hypothetical protein HOP50_03g25280 [Chloropicon primus]|uniref:Uncharacterized protein n=1 Tax=Chloropicon primus TaxID=1764295 RepID=A0A5B8MKU6_9CHLO|nr:hypothetical protein A3770_03p25280 [Chloropicon primus]UPQ99221.1 hypothetical protein HOP50_03g25280 [Chloropicon primus]|mmetsp:Transcript_13707/g.38625  ORF Transcript_13707/g.38625 Transcript_13707/m.38625 type:complete len:509 (+) Transcript_13707:51-1577(+)|eukprot:QDZ20010.1 hypothetical protein A3770_03p25280 [Chloropicon primus]